MTQMTLERFEEIVAAYGATPERWPDEERHAAEMFLANSERAQTIIRDQVALDTLLDEMPVGDVSPALKQSVLSSGAQLVGSASVQDMPAAPDDTFMVRWFGRIRRTAQGILADVDDIELSGLGWAGSASLLGGAAALGILVSVYVPNALDESYLSVSEDDIFVLALGTPDYDVESFSLNGDSR